jgi:superfamily II DNA/RNA helicase/very-short-patch-repair endonuclease
MRLHLHQEQAIRIANQDRPYVLTTGTGSGKSLSYIIPIVNHVLRRGTGQGIQAIVVYPMNALANSQREELDKFLRRGFGDAGPLVTYQRYTGQETQEQRDEISKNPPDIILTNYVMLELILTRINEREVVRQAKGLKFLVFDELHTYRGRQGADVAMLIRRCRDAFNKELMCVGTSATMATDGTSVDQAQVVSDVATRIFGQTIESADIVGETLLPSASDFDFEDADVQTQLKAAVAASPPDSYEGFTASPFASWIERRFGLRLETETGKQVRQEPTAIKGKDGAAAELAEQLGIDVDEVENAIQAWLDHGGQVRHPKTSFPFFAYRLHQFITRGDTVWATLEPEDERRLYLRGQQRDPSDPSKILLPMVFCRSCGQEYYRVERLDHGYIEMRENFRTTREDGIRSGYLYVSSKSPWSEDPVDVQERVPDDWLEEHKGTWRVKKSLPAPEVLRVKLDGTIEEDGGLEAAFVPAPFRFCLNPECKVAHNARMRSDATKLGTIGTDGRSTATSVLALSTILKLKADPDLVDRPEARKLLSFTDNRQDASLQAGHFNDFVEVSLVRSSLYRAMHRVERPVRYDELVQHVEAAMDLPFHLYSDQPELRGAAREETQRALRSVLKYFLYRDLERGWRITSPNLEQCGLLEIDYLSIREMAEDDEFWRGPLKNRQTNSDEEVHPALKNATADQRENVARVLLDHMRRSLAIHEDSLDKAYQEKICDQSRQRLCEPWVIDDPRDLVNANVAWPRSKTPDDYFGDIFVSRLSNFGLYLRRSGILPGELKTDDARIIILDLFKRLVPWGLLKEVRSPKKGATLSGYQVPASVMLWNAGDGTSPAVDHLRVTQTSAAEDDTNDYFVKLYKGFAEIGSGLESREHTAQVPAIEREEREHRFRDGKLDILFCSPTMELGVDIAQLNVVNMRNVPPTPANYAQRSGRAGRQGDAALVYTYCSGFSPHDQYYFKRPKKMVAGSVVAPRVDLHNQDLIKAHVHAIWLSESGMKLGKTLAEVLVVTEEDLALPLRKEVREILDNVAIQGRALVRAQTLLNSVGDELKEAYWYRESWLADVLRSVPQEFDEACERWRSLFRAAVQQRKNQHAIVGDHSRPQTHRDRAKSLRSQAEEQLRLLTDASSAFESDFYTYRYLASEGFLPGYNFPRLPISAFVPARRGGRGRNEYLSRPRFLAISEFGPRAIIYHEGARYRVNKVNLSFDENTQELTEYRMIVCSECGYGHHRSTSETGEDTCKSCQQKLRPTDQINEMIKLQNVTVKRAEQITSDEEERRRMGYDILTTFRFSEVAGDTDVRKAEIMAADQVFATMRYGDAAQIWRINLGWRTQTETKKERGFALDIERGYWATNKEADEFDKDDPMSKQVRRVVPYVEDHRNLLTLRLTTDHDKEVIATLQSALKRAIQQEYLLEPGELAAEALPNREDRRVLVFYEATEGGAGVLKKLLDPGAISKIARVALEVCHFDPDTGEDFAPKQDNDIECALACYDCLLDYGNQPDHKLVDRHQIRDMLITLRDSTTEASSSSASRTDHYDELIRTCDSELEKKWLKQVRDLNLRLPSHGQFLLESCSTRPDFFYKEARTAIYIDGPVHDEPDTAVDDRNIEKRLTASGFMFIRFHYKEDWATKLAEFADIFGELKS